jgi:hypothetical protein
MKICTKCKKEKDFTEFNSRKNSKSGYRSNCKECRRNRDRNNALKIKDNILPSKKRDYKKYYELYKNKINERRRYRNKNDNLYYLKNQIRSMNKKAFKKKGFKKNSKSEEILGCSFEEFLIYIENKFDSWMNWENKGKYNGELFHGWDIDHIIPLSTAINEEDIIKLNHFTNLQPLCSKVNRDIKKDNIYYSNI